MKFKKNILAFLMVAIMGSHSFIYAKEPNCKQIVSQAHQEEATKKQELESLAKLYHKAGLDSPEVILNVLIELGISQETLQESIGQGKKIYDLLKEKEISLGRFKKALEKEYKSRIKSAKKNKIITRQEAKILTELLKERMDLWQTR